MHNHKDERSILERQGEVTPWAGEVSLIIGNNPISNYINTVSAFTLQEEPAEESEYSYSDESYIADMQVYYPLVQSEVRDVYLGGGYFQIDFKKARENNDKFSKDLGWDTYYIDLYNLFSFKESSGTNSPEFIEAVANFQWTAGMQEKDIDGMIGPITWSKLVKKIIQTNDPLNGERLKKAIQYNRNNEANWISSLIPIQKVIGHHEESSLSESAFAKHLALWQKNNGLPADGMLGAKTWAKLSLKLDQFNDIQVEFSVQYGGIVRPVNGVRLYSSPIPNARQYSSSIKNGQEIKVLGFAPRKAPGWVYVQSNEGGKGWLPSFYLIFLTSYDKTIFKSKYLVMQNDTLTDVVKKNYEDFYKRGMVRTGFDERTIIEAIVMLNENIPESALYFKGEGSDAFLRDTVLDRDMAALRDMYQRVKLKQNTILYLPKDDYIEFLFNNGSLSRRAEWKNDVIILGKSIYGFINGVQDGLNQASKDFIVGLWELLKSILSGDIIEDIKNIINTIEKHGIKIIDLLIEAGGKKYETLKSHLSHPNPEKRYYSFGFILGFILFEVVLVLLTAGAGNAMQGITKTKKVKEILEKFPSIKKIANRIDTKTLNKLDDNTKAKALDLVLAGLSALEYIKNYSHIYGASFEEQLSNDTRESEIQNEHLQFTQEFYFEVGKVASSIPPGDLGEEFILEGLNNGEISPIRFQVDGKTITTSGALFFYGQHNTSNHGIDLLGIKIDKKTKKITYFIFEIKGGTYPKVGAKQLEPAWIIRNINAIFSSHSNPKINQIRENLKAELRIVHREIFGNSLPDSELDEIIKEKLISRVKRRRILTAFVIPMDIGNSVLKQIKTRAKNVHAAVRLREIPADIDNNLFTFNENISQHDIEFEIKYGQEKINEIKNKVIQVTNGKFNSYNWFQGIIKATFLGSKINSGVHLILYRKLQQAEAWLISQPQYKGMPPVELGRTLGLDRPGVRYSGARLSAENQAMHSFGLAIDIDPVGNPWIGAGWVQYDKEKLKERTRMLQTLKKASGEALKGQTVFEYLDSIASEAGHDTRAAYRILAQRNQEFIEYLKNNPAELRYWKNSASFSGRDPLKGFLNLHPDLVYALREVAGLAWGAIDFGPRASGDIMHFDLRTLGVGKVIATHIKGYIPVYGHPTLPKSESEFDLEYDEYTEELELHEAIEEAEWEDNYLEPEEDYEWQDDSLNTETV